MNLPGKAESIWLDTTPNTHYPPLTSEKTVDVAVIGGGIAGLLTAYFLKQAGKKVAVIEAREIVTGTTGHTTAHASIAHGVIYETLSQRFGVEGARRYAEVNQAAIETLEQIMQTEGIEADWRRTHEYLFAASPTETEKARKEYEATRKLGLPTLWLETAPAPWPTFGVIDYPDQAQFHPRKLLLALAERIHRDGSVILEQTRALDVNDGEPMVVETDRGNVKATDVVVATLYPILNRGFYFARLEAYASLVLGVTVKGEFPEAMFDSTDEESHYLRRQAHRDGDIILVGGEGFKVGQKDGAIKGYQKLAAYARQILPVKEILYRFMTHDTFPHDDLPYIGLYTPKSEHLYVATGFGGWGMTNGTVAGRLLADLILKQPNESARLFDPARFKPDQSALKLAQQSVTVGKQFLQSKLGRQATLAATEIEPGEGQVVEDEGQKVAAAKDEAGKLRLVSATCQHMGCNVEFNRAEKTWDCPCHGSRYTATGEVLYAPTVRGLPNINDQGDSSAK